MSIASDSHKVNSMTKEAKTTEQDLTQGLVVQDVWHSFRDRAILQGVNIHVRRGEIVGLLGPNGSGKSTFFHFIIGLLQSTGRGRVFLDGRDITGYPMYKRARLGLGYLPQDSSVFRGLSVEDNIMAVLEICQPDRQLCRRMLDELLEEFSITHLRKDSSATLSGGERRRLEIARLLASGPEFVLQDEPLAGIDPIAVRDIRELILHLKERNIGILISDHNVYEALDLVDRAYVLYDGKVLLEGTAAEIVSSKDAREVYLGQDFNLKNDGKNGKSKKL